MRANATTWRCKQLNFVLSFSFVPSLAYLCCFSILFKKLFVCSILFLFFFFSVSILLHFRYRMNWNFREFKREFVASFLFSFVFYLFLLFFSFGVVHTNEIGHWFIIIQDFRLIWLSLKWLKEFSRDFLCLFVLTFFSPSWFALFL